MYMAKNGIIGDGRLISAAKDRTQVFNPATGNYVKRDSSTGKFIDVKSDGKAFKGVTREPQITHVGISIPKSVAIKAEQSVIMTVNNKSLNGK